MIVLQNELYEFRRIQIFYFKSFLRPRRVLLKAVMIVALLFIYRTFRGERNVNRKAFLFWIRIREKK